MQVIRIKHNIILGQPQLKRHYLNRGTLLINVINKEVKLDKYIYKRGIRLATKGTIAVKNAYVAVRVQLDTYLNKEFRGIKEVKLGKTVKQIVLVIYYDYLDLFIKQESIDALLEH